MKIQAPPFIPRNLPSPSTKPHDGLREENPLLIRAVDTALIGVELLHHAPEGPAHHVGAGVAALVDVGALAWGVQMLAHGETTLERIEAAGSLSLAAQSGVTVYNHLRGEEEGLEHLVLPLALVHSAAEIVVGGADVVRGRKEHDGNRAVAGLALMAVGAGLAAAHLIPGAALPLHLGAAAAAVTRQFLISKS